MEVLRRRDGVPDSPVCGLFVITGHIIADVEDPNADTTAENDVTDVTDTDPVTEPDTEPDTDVQNVIEE